MFSFKQGDKVCSAFDDYAQRRKRIGVVGTVEPDGSVLVDWGDGEVDTEFDYELERSSGKQVVVFTSPGCIPCRRTKTLMRELGVRFDTVDVTVDVFALNYITGDLGYSMTPVVVDFSRDVHWAGHDPDAIKQYFGGGDPAA